MTGCIHTLSQLTFGVHVRNNMLKKLIVFSLVVDGRAFHLQHHIIARHRSSSHTLPLAAMKKVPLRRGLDGEGTPSAIGWKSGRLERLTDWTVSKEANRPVITQYNPNSLWLWSRWKGTVLSLIYKSVLLSMASGLAIDFSARSISNASWRIFSVPPASDPLIQSLEGLRKLWGYQLTLGTFILTFFTSQAYAYWQRVYDCTRCIQGRINDFCMLFTLGAQRGPPTEGTTGQSNKAERLVQLCTRLLRMSHTLFWAATATASNGLDDCEKFKEDLKDCPLPVDDAHIGPLLLSRYGLEALVETGLLTEEEVAGLAKTKLPPSQYGYILLEWVGLYSLEGMRDGILRDSAGFEENLLRQLTSLRGEFFNLDDYSKCDSHVFVYWFVRCSLLVCKECRKLMHVVTEHN